MKRFLIWLWGQLDVFNDSPRKGDPVSLLVEETPSRLDEFHKATYAELYSAAWAIVAGPPPAQPGERKKYLALLSSTLPQKGAKIEFNERGEGRVLETDCVGHINIGMANLPVRVQWDPSRLCLKPTEQQSREFYVRLMGGQIPGRAGGMELPA